MRLPGFQAEATLRTSTQQSGRASWRVPAASGVQAQAEPCVTCEDCYLLCQDLGWDHSACTHCLGRCGPCPRIPGPLDP
jgi:hypothetical protein